MRLKVLSSGSSANGYLLYNGSEALILECGVPYLTALKELDYDRGKIVGAVVTHSHGDHAKFIEQYLEASIPVYTSRGTIGGLKLKEGLIPTAVKSMDKFTLGGFNVLAFDTQHDCEEPLGFLINHDEMGATLFATDTYYLKYKFKGLSHILIECNYSPDVIDENARTGQIPWFVRNRVMKSHMSLETTLLTLKETDLSRMNEIILIHMSSHNSNPEESLQRVEEQTGLPVYIAHKGLEVPFNKSEQC